MDIRFPGLELNEPLDAHPGTGMIIGGIAGVVFGLLASQADLHVPWRSAFYGYVVAGLTAGLIIGASLPLFRSRLMAGFAVGFAMTPALGILWWFLEESMSFGVTVFLGFCCGPVYSLLFWDYRPEADQS